MRDIALLTTSRADFGIYRPLLDRMTGSRTLRYRLLVSGSHLERKFGMTVREIEQGGYAVFRRIPCLQGDMAGSMARMMDGMAGLFRSWRPHLLLVLGDRFEMFAGALASVPFHIPLVHLHGGELTLGALDDSFRHALSKLSHLHFTATQEAADRLHRMGEERWRITVSGAPALDRLRLPRSTPADLPEGFLLVTYHPVTRDPGREKTRVDALVEALEKAGRPCVVTAPNVDPGHAIIRKCLRRFCDRHSRSQYRESVGIDGYFSLMSCAAAMVGNSSSGILEASSFRLPVVNIGTRQEGRFRARNVIDCRDDEASISRSLRRALKPSFRRSLIGLKNPYGDGRAAERIVSRLEAVTLGDRLLRKAFCDS